MLVSYFRTLMLEFGIRIFAVTDALGEYCVSGSGNL